MERFRPTDTRPSILPKAKEGLRGNLSSYALEYLRQFDRGETDGITCWRSSSIVRRAGSNIAGVGLFALKDIKPEEIVAIKPGHVVDKRTIREKADIIKGSHQQIGINDSLTGLTPEEVDRNLVGYNHSCDPNAKVAIVKNVPLAFLVTKKNIREGDEITVDYSVSQTFNTHRIFFCKCGSPKCRKAIQPASDWLDENFQNNNAEDFPWLVQEKIREIRELPEPRRRGKLAVLYTLRNVDIINLLAGEIERREKEIDEIISRAPSFQQGALKILAKFIGGRGEMGSMRNTLFKHVQAFVNICPFANIEDFGIDINNPQTVGKNLDKVVEFARKIDQNFN